MSNDAPIFVATFNVDASEVSKLEYEILWPLSLTGEPTLSIFESDNPKVWRAEIFTNWAVSDTEAADIQRTIEANLDFEIAPLIFAAVKQVDWVSESQKLRQAINAGRFVVYGDHIDYVPQANQIGINLDAGQAFGTGSHETTAGCLEIMDRLTTHPKNVFDLGTGTGLLAIAAHKLWDCKVGGSDIDPIAINVSTENLQKNDVPIIDSEDTYPGGWLVVADGMQEPTIESQAPFDLIIANILANPLIAMADEIVHALDNEGYLILSGINLDQEEKINKAYTNLGLILIDKLHRGEWSILLFQKA